MRTLIKNGTIIDGSGQQRFHGDMIINDERIQAVGRFTEEHQTFDTVIDANNAYITPGFIDTHSHTDLAYFLDHGLRPKIMQGVTTEVIGQCGLGVAPMPRAKQTSWRNSLIIGNPPIPWTWETTEEYLNALEAHGLESNLVPFTGHGVLRYALRQDRAGTLTAQERRTLQSFTEEAFVSGVFGVSFGFIYIPAIFADNKEIQAILEIASKYQGLVAVHLRSESDELVEAVGEMLELINGYNCRLHLSHLKTIGQRNRQKVDTVLQMVETHNLTFDAYPYTAGSTTLLSIFPPFVVEGNGLDETLRKLEEPKIRQQIKRLFSGTEIPSKGLAWDNLPNLLGWGNIIIVDSAETSHHNIIGYSLSDIARDRKCDPADAAMNLIIEARGAIRMIDYYEKEETLVKILSHPNGMIGTDTLIGGKVHPRVFGTYPRIIQRYVFQQQLLSLETAISKMTTKPATMLGLSHRGLIRPGYIADLVIFDDTFQDHATFDKPEQYPEGLKYVLINGKIKVNNGAYYDNFPGRVLRKSDRIL